MRVAEAEAVKPDVKRRDELEVDGVRVFHEHTEARRVFLMVVTQFEAVRLSVGPSGRIVLHRDRDHSDR